VQIINGLLGDRVREQRERPQSILRTLTTRKQQLEEAISTGASNVEAFKRTVDSLQQALSEATAKADLASQSGLSLIILGAVLVLLRHSISSIYCARRPKVYSFVQPVLDFMQSMPSFGRRGA
jgi:hypothetical protein